MCMQGTMNLAPHLYVLPLELSPFRDVLAALGAQEAFSAAQFTALLQVCEACWTDARGDCAVRLCCLPPGRPQPSVAALSRR